MLKHGKIMLLVGNDFAYYKTENNAKEPTSFKKKLIRTRKNSVSESEESSDQE